MRYWRVANDFQAVWIGAAGGLFLSSSQTLITTIEATGSQKITFYPDSDILTNSQVGKRDFKIWRWLQQLDYTVHVGWWGQESKEHPDIDELDDFSALKFLTIEQFNRLADQSSKESLKPVTSKHNSQNGRELTQQTWEYQGLLTQIKAVYGKTAWRYYKKFGYLPTQAKPIEPPATTTPPADCSAIVRYDPDQNGLYELEATLKAIPTHDEWVAMGRPRLMYEPCDRIAIWKRALELGYPYILDSSIVGSGKSTAVGEFLSELGETGTQNAIYLADDYRNPSTPSLENLPEAVSGAGLMIDSTKFTAAGVPYRRRANSGEKPDIDPLCVEDANVQALRTKGVNVGRGKDSPLCMTCPHFGGCDYLNALEAQENEPVLRSNINKFNPGDEKNTIAFVEEAERSLNGHQILTAEVGTLTRELEKLATREPDLYLGHFEK